MYRVLVPPPPSSSFRCSSLRKNLEKYEGALEVSAKSQGRLRGVLTIRHDRGSRQPEQLGANLYWKPFLIWEAPFTLAAILRSRPEWRVSRKAIAANQRR